MGQGCARPGVFSGRLLVADSCGLRRTNADWNKLPEKSPSNRDTHPTMAVPELMLCWTKRTSVGTRPGT